MNLIEKIEEASSLWTKANAMDGGHDDKQDAYILVHSAWWPCIKAALEAALEMEEFMGLNCYIERASQRKFREAFEVKEAK